MASPTPTADKVLVIFDYDWSLVNENSDMFIFSELHAPLVSAINARCKQWRDDDSWTALMDEQLCALAVQQPHITPELIRATLARIPVLEHMLDAVRLAVDVYGADVKIVSDANTVYIESMLAHHALSSYISDIFTNVGFFERDATTGCETSRLRVEPYHALTNLPHGCTDCPTNMCKGAIVELIRRTDYTHVLYIGDGSGDFCPATRLGERDVVFARADDSVTGRAFGLLKQLRQYPERVRARVVPWSTGLDIYNHFDAFFQSLRAQ